MLHLPILGFLLFSLKNLLRTVARKRVRYIDLKYKMSVLFHFLLVLVQFICCAKENTVPPLLVF